MSNNPYSAQATANPEVQLCAVTWRGDVPVPNFADRLYSFPPIGQVRVEKAAKVNERELEHSKPRASRLELKGHGSATIRFDIELIADTYPGATMNADGTPDEPWPPIDQFRDMAAHFLSLDERGRNQAFAVRYPTSDAMNVEIAFFETFAVQDNAGEDRLTVSVALKEIQTGQAVSSGAGSGSGGTGGGAGGTGGGGSRNKGKDKPGSKGGDGAPGGAGNPGFSDGFKQGVFDTLYNLGGFRDGPAKDKNTGAYP